jgi:hypothetical protein
LNNELYLIFGIAISGLLLLSFLGFAIYYRKAIKLAGLVLREAGKAVRKLYIIPFLGLIQSILAAMLSALLIGLIGLLFTVQNSKLNNYIVPLFTAYLIFWYYWTVVIIYIIGQVSVSSAVSKWYWRHTQVTYF